MSRTCSRLLAAAALVIVRDIQSIIVGGGLVQRLTTSKLPRTTSRNSPLLLMATGLPFTVALNRPGPSWQQIPYPYASVVSKVYAPSAMAMYAVFGTAPPSVLKLPVDWAAIKVPALFPRVPSPFRWDCRHTCLRSQYSLGDSATLGAEVAGGLGSDQSTSAFPEYLFL